MELFQMTETEFKKELDKWQNTVKEKKVKEDAQIKDTDWICDKCQQKNQMDFKDINSAICKNIRCKAKNEVIEYMIQSKNDTKALNLEDEYYQHYTKQKQGINVTPGQPPSGFSSTKNENRIE